MENRLKIIRTELKITQKKLAEISGLSRYTINQIENNQIVPNGETIAKLVKATKIPANQIFFDLDVV